MVAMYGLSFNCFLALHAAVIRIPVSCASSLRDFLDEFSYLVPVSSCVFFVSAVHFISAFLFSNDPIVC
jgi:hypothetical protein